MDIKVLIDLAKQLVLLLVHFVSVLLMDLIDLVTELLKHSLLVQDVVCSGLGGLVQLALDLIKIVDTSRTLLLHPLLELLLDVKLSGAEFLVLDVNIEGNSLGSLSFNLHLHIFGE